MAFERIVEIIITTQDGESIKVSDLDISFDIERTYDYSENTARFNIFNSSRETRSKFLIEGNNIKFKAGYKDEGDPGIIFQGFIYSVLTEKDGVDWNTEIQAVDFGSGSENLFKERVSLTYDKGSSLSSVINDIVSILGIPVAGINNVDIDLPGGFVYAGSLRGALEKIKEILKNDSVGLYFDNSELVIFNIGEQDSNFGVVRITEDSGLVGSIRKEIDEAKGDEERVEFSSLLNYKLRPNSIVQIVTEFVNGAYIIEKCNFYGNNFGGDFFVTVGAVE